jgi:hypothetical protein
MAIAGNEQVLRLLTQAVTLEWSLMEPPVYGDTLPVFVAQVHDRFYQLLIENHFVPPTFTHHWQFVVGYDTLAQTFIDTYNATTTLTPGSGGFSVYTSVQKDTSGGTMTVEAFILWPPAGLAEIISLDEMIPQMIESRRIVDH